MDARKNVLLLGFHGCLLTPHAENKNFFSPAIIDRAKQGKYVGFVGIVDECASNFVLSYESRARDYMEAIEARTPNLSALDILTNPNSFQASRHKEVALQNLFTYRTIENFERETKLPHLATSTPEDANGPPDPLLKCGSGLVNILKPAEECYEAQKEILDEFKQKPIEKFAAYRKFDQVIDAVLLLRAKFPDVEIKIDYIDISLNAKNALNFPYKSLPKRVELEVFYHDSASQLNAKIVSIAMISCDGIRRSARVGALSVFTRQPRHAAPVLSTLNLQDAPPYQELPGDESSDEYTVICGCIPWKRSW